MSISAEMVRDLREVTGVGMMDCKKALVEVGGNQEEAIKYLREKGLAKAAKKADRATSEGALGVAISGGTGVMIELKCETDFVAKNEEFKTFVQNVATKALSANADSIEALPAADTDVSGLISKLGENIQLGRLIKVTGGDFVSSYVHSNGKVGCLVALKGAASEEALQAGKDIAMQATATSPICISSDQVPQEILAKEKEIYLEQAKTEGKPAEMAEKIVLGRINKYYKEVCLNEQAFIKDDKISIAQMLKKVGADLSIVQFVRVTLGEDAQAK